MTDNNHYKRVDTEGWSLDAELRLADWTKQHWDLPLEADEFLGILGVSRAPLTEQQRVLDQFCNLPAAQAMPAELAEELKRQGLALR